MLFMALLQRFSFILLFATLTGCGGSSGGFDETPDEGEGTPEPVTITLSISNVNVEKAVPATLTATVMQGTTPLSGKLVTFSIDNAELANFETDVSSSATNTDGQAEIILLAGLSSGSGSITATVDGIDSNAVTFTSAGDGDDGSSNQVTLNLAISNIDVARATPATLVLTLMQGSTPVPGVLVTFSIDNEDLASFATDISTSITDVEGKASIGLLAGSSSGAGQVSATINNTNFVFVNFNSAGDGGDVGEPTAAAISLFASSQQIASSGSDTVNLTTIAKDKNNNLVEGVTITFSATSGQIEVVNAVTGADGQATAVLKTNNEPTNRTISVTSISGEINDTVDVQVIGTSINLTGSSSLAINDANNFFIQVLNSDGVGISNATVDLTLSPPTTGTAAALTIVSSVVTDMTGQANFTVTGTSGGSNTLIATAVGVSSEHPMTVQADSFLFSRFNNGSGQGDVVPDSTLPDVFLSDSATIELTWTQSNTPIADGTIVSFTSTRGTVVQDSNTTQDGKITATISSSNAGKALVTVTGNDNGVTLSNQLEFEFIAEDVATIDAQASPSSIAPNGDTSTISVIVKDVNGNLVKGKTIDFSLTGTSGGDILPASAVTDSNGSASTVYTSNTVSSQNGISITATVKEEPSISDTVTLTVADRDLFITLGTGNELIEVDSTTFNKQYVAFVTDVDSASPAKNTVLTISAVPQGYRKGVWSQALDENGSFESWFTNVTATCGNEDLNVDGVLDVGEDTNGDSQLTPGNVAAVIGEVTTDDQGSALIDIKYPQNFGGWININLVVSAKVGGTESLRQTTFILPALLEDVLNEDAPPPQGLSPFGFSNDCTDVN